MQGLAIRIARAINRAISRKRGKVFSDRYHEHVLATPSEVRAAIHYVVHNDRKHMAQAGRPLGAGFIDEHSSAVYLAGLEPSPLPRRSSGWFGVGTCERDRSRSRVPGASEDGRDVITEGEQHRNSPRARR
jgi:hypothetical protein